MKRANRYFILGSCIALLCFGILANNGILGNLYAELFISKLPRELRLGTEIGLLSVSECNKRTLNRKISRGKFAAMLTKTINLLGFYKISGTKDLAQSGIFTGSPSRRNITRKTVIEAMCRAIIYIADKDSIVLPSGKPSKYRDYKAPEKYTGALNYLQKNYIIRGYSNGYVGARRKLSIKEASYFLFRLYEAVSANLMMKNTNLTGIRFIDIQVNHPIMKKISALTTTGAFDIVNLRPSFDGDSFISKNDITQLAKGIILRQKHKIDEITFKAIFKGENGYSPAKRKELALILEYVITSLSSNKINKIDYDYIDVKKDTPEFEALKTLANNSITMGYSTHKFVANERITWFEAISLMYEVIKNLNLTPKPKRKQQLAQKTDIKRLVAILKAKRRKVRRILSNRPRYKR